jgi:hypothetical protein
VRYPSTLTIFVGTQLGLVSAEVPASTNSPHVVLLITFVGTFRCQSKIPIPFSGTLDEENWIFTCSTHIVASLWLKNWFQHSTACVQALTLYRSPVVPLQLASSIAEMGFLNLLVFLSVRSFCRSYLTLENSVPWLSSDAIRQYCSFMLYSMELFVANSKIFLFVFPASLFYLPKYTPVADLCLSLIQTLVTLD